MSCGRNVWQFPHSSEEFPADGECCGISYDSGVKLLQHWLDQHLRPGEPPERNPGRYNLRHLRGYQKLHVDDVVLFVKSRFIVGGGKVLEQPTCRRSQGVSYSGTPTTYEGYLVFDPNTLIVFNPPVPQSRIRDIRDASGVVANGFDGPRYRGPFGGAWPLDLRQHEFINDVIQRIVRRG